MVQKLVTIVKLHSQSMSFFPRLTFVPNSWVTLPSRCRPSSVKCQLERGGNTYIGEKKASTHWHMFE